MLLHSGVPFPSVCLVVATAPGFFPATWPELQGFYLAPTGPMAAGERILDYRRSELNFDATDTTIDLSYRFSDDVLGYVTFATVV